MSKKYVDWRDEVPFWMLELGLFQTTIRLGMIALKNSPDAEIQSAI